MQFRDFFSCVRNKWLFGSTQTFIFGIVIGVAEVHRVNAAVIVVIVVLFEGGLKGKTAGIVKVACCLITGFAVGFDVQLAGAVGFQSSDQLINQLFADTVAAAGVVRCQPVKLVGGVGIGDFAIAGVSAGFAVFFRKQKFGVVRIIVVFGVLKLVKSIIGQAYGDVNAVFVKNARRSRYLTNRFQVVRRDIGSKGKHNYTSFRTVKPSSKIEVWKKKLRLGGSAETAGVPFLDNLFLDLFMTHFLYLFTVNQN